MAKTNTIPFPQNIQSPAVTIVNATGFTATNPGTAPTNTVLFATAGADGSIMKSIVISSDDTSSRVIELWISTDSGTTKYRLSSVTVPASSGSAGTVNVDFFAGTVFVGTCYDETGKPVLPLTANARLYCAVTTAAVTASKTVYITGVQFDY